MEEIILQLKMFRIRQHISIAELARRMNAERARLSEIENGRGGLTLKRLYQWAEALGYKVTIKFEEK